MISGFDFTTMLNSSALLFGAFGLALVYFTRGIDRWPKGLCAAVFASTIACAAVQLAEYGAVQAGMPYTTLLALSLAKSVATPIPSLLVFAYFLYCCGTDIRTSAAMRSECVFTGVLIVTGILAKLSNEAIVVSGQEPHFGPWIALCLLSILALTAINLATLLRNWKKVTTVQGIMFLACFLAQPAVQIILVELLLSIGLAQRYLEQKEEAAQQRARAAVLQMRPHFIHNTLSSIYYLCAKDAKAAQVVIRDFSRYLQHNFTAIAEEETIPFDKELEHTKAYLAIEQACHEGHLFVEFDTPATFFRMPPLTLQPIVENAVKHGLDPDSSPLHISIVTRAMEQGVRVVVEDSGPGYAPSDGGTQFALDNVRWRLKTMCDGTLEVEARETGGTKVVVFIPWKAS